MDIQRSHGLVEGYIQDLEWHPQWSEDHIYQALNATSDYVYTSGKSPSNEIEDNV